MTRREKHLEVSVPELEAILKEIRGNMRANHCLSDTVKVPLKWAGEFCLWHIDRDREVRQYGAGITFKF